MLDKDQIQQIIPHRPPFLLIDSIEFLQEGEKAIGIKSVSQKEWFFQGHFPNNPIMPGVIIIEALAQVGSVALLSLPKFKGKTAVFGSIHNAKFKKAVVPESILKLETSIVKLRNCSGTGNGIAYMDGNIICQCEFLFFIK